MDSMECFGALILLSCMLIWAFRIFQGDLQPDCLADEPVAGPCQPTANPKGLQGVGLQPKNLADRLL
eukprot:191862-Pelagomonas_calceolata.AAC.1